MLGVIKVLLTVLPQALQRKMVFESRTPVSVHSSVRVLRYASGYTYLNCLLHLFDCAEGVLDDDDNDDDDDDERNATVRRKRAEEEVDPLDAGFQDCLLETFPNSHRFVWSHFRFRYR